MAEEKVINLKEMAAANNVEVKENTSTLFTKLGEENRLHGFKKVIKVDKNRVIDSISQLVEHETEKYIRIPFEGVTYTSTKFSLKEIEDILLNDPSINISVPSKVSKKSELDAVILNEKVDTLVDETEAKILKGIKLTKDGKIYLVFDSSIMISTREKVSNISHLVEDYQSSIRKDIIPDTILRLRKDYFLIKQDIKSLLFGRVGNDLVLEVSIGELFKRIIVPKLIITKGLTDTAMSESAREEARVKYQNKVKIATTYDFKESFLYLSIETQGSVKSLEIVVKKSNFVCFNVSFRNEFVREFIKEKVQETILEGIEELEDKEPEVYAKRLRQLEGMDLEVKMIPLASLSKLVSSIRNVGIGEMIKITSSNTPLFIPVLEINAADFLSNKNKSVLNSFVFRTLVQRKPNPQEIQGVFKKLIWNNDPFISEYSGGYEQNRIAIIPDPKRIVLSSFLEYGDNYSDYGISINTKDSMSSFSMNLV